MYSNVDSKELFNVVLLDIQMVVDGRLKSLEKEGCEAILELLEEFKRGDFLEDKTRDIRGSVLFINDNHLWLFDHKKDNQVKYEAKNYNKLRKVKP
jgi:hypothetical protein